MSKDILDVQLKLPRSDSVEPKRQSGCEVFVVDDIVE